MYEVRKIIKLNNMCTEWMAEWTIELVTSSSILTMLQKYLGTSKTTKLSISE
jgi:hypothetical protein